MLVNFLVMPPLSAVLFRVDHQRGYKLPVALIEAVTNDATFEPAFHRVWDVRECLEAEDLKSVVTVAESRLITRTPASRHAYIVGAEQLESHPSVLSRELSFESYLPALIWVNHQRRVEISG